MSLRQITVNDLPVGRSVDETLRLIKAFQFTVRIYFNPPLRGPLRFSMIRINFETDINILLFHSQDKHGEVCPANWTEGSRTMKADPVGSKEYFSAANGENGHANGVNGHANGTSDAKRKRTD